MDRIFALAITVLFATGMVGCSSMPEVKDIAERSTGQITPIPFLVPVNDIRVDNPQGLYSLSDKHKKAFLSFYNAPENDAMPPHLRFASYLERELSRFTFRGETLNAEEAMNTAQGNCLSLAVLTAALARVAGFEISFQRVHTAPLYYRHDKIMTVTSHVRTKVHNRSVEKERNAIRFAVDYAVIDYFPSYSATKGDQISGLEFTSMYFQNLAGDALLANNLTEALELITKALTIYPNNTEAINTFAVILRRQGKTDQALAVYRHAVQQDLTNIALMENYAFLLAKNDNEAEAKTILSQLGDVNDDNPYRWIDIADRALINARFAKAKYYYSRALELAPYLHEAHYGLALTYYARRQDDIATRHMKKAVELSNYTPDAKLYHAKWQVLQEEMRQSEDDLISHNYKFNLR